MPVNLNDIMSLSFRGKFNNQRILFTHNYVCTQAPSAAKTPTEVSAAFAGEFTTGFKVAYTDKYLAMMPDSEYVMDIIRAQLIYPTRYVFWDTTVNYPGTGPDTGAAPNLAVAILLRTDKAGRDQTSTKHIGPMPVAFNDLGNLTAPAKTAALAFGDQLVTGLDLSADGNGKWYPVVFHKKPAGVPSTFDMLLTRTVQTTTRTERRRTLGFGE